MCLRSLSELIRAVLTRRDMEEADQRRCRDRISRNFDISKTLFRKIRKLASIPSCFPPLALYALPLPPPSLQVVEPVFSRSTCSFKTQLLPSSSRQCHLLDLALLIPLSTPPLLSPHKGRNRNQRSRGNLLVLLLNFDQFAKPPKDSTPTHSTNSLEYLKSVDARIS